MNDVNRDYPSRQSEQDFSRAKPLSQQEQHWQTIIQVLIGLLMLVLAAMGGIMVSKLDAIDEKVTAIDTRLIDVEKKLTAVATDEHLLRKTVEEHMRAH